MLRLQTGEEILLNTFSEVKAHLSAFGSLHHCTVRNVDFTRSGISWMEISMGESSFLGCRFKSTDELILHEKGALLFPEVEGLPYNPYRVNLYTWQELMAGYTPEQDNSVDREIYDFFAKSRFNPEISQALYQRIHDHAIDHALRELLDFDANGMTGKRCVGIMGGHGTARTDLYFRKVVETAKLLTEQGYYIASGGGPGIMEAANLGAWLAGQGDRSIIDRALETLAAAPRYSSPGFSEAAQKVLEMFPNGGESLAIPTWFYGHEPSNLFATQIAKYFSNSIREDTLLSISLHGVVFAPGSAGTTQEIFMDATQNHYGTLNYYSPMVFLGKKRYEIDTLIYPLMRQLSYGKEYHPLLLLTDEPLKILNFLQCHPPIRKAQSV